MNPPLTPRYILRGHSSAIHSLHIFQHNLRLISGDADGWIVVWDLVSKRPVAAWKGHEGAILQVRGFAHASASASKSGDGDGVGVWVYSHGRDHKLRVWNIRPQDEAVLQRALPVDVTSAGASAGAGAAQGSQPWMVHSLPVNALNFCAFGILFLEFPSSSSSSSSSSYEGSPEEGKGQTNPEEQEKAQTQSHSQPDPSPEKTPPSKENKPDRLLAAPNALDSGAIDLFHLPLERRVCTIPPPAGIKPGMVMAVELFLAPRGEDIYVASGYEDGHVMVFRCGGILKGRNQESSPGHPWNQKWTWDTLYVSRLHSQPALSIDVSTTHGYVLSSGADALLIKHPVPGWDAAPGSSGSGAVEPDGKALKTVNTKHAGQQGLRIRNDGKIFATAGWDSRVRVYSCKTMKEVAVLKWHKEGCYAVAFASVDADGDSSGETPESEARSGGESTQELAKREFSLAAVHQQRNHKVQKTHWLAAGSKDGKISLWDIY